MNKVLKFGLYLGVAASLASCGSSEHFMQDDVYSTRTPMMPPGTDLNDVTDYATFVAKKEQSEIQEQTAYVSPRQYTDYFYNSQYVYYGYSPYFAMTGIGYYGYNGYNSPYSMYHAGYGYGGAFYPTVGFGGYYGNGYNPYWGNNYYGGNSYYGYGSPYSYSGNTYSNHTLNSKPNTAGNLSYSSAKVAGGRGSNLAPEGYKSKSMQASGMVQRTRVEANSSMRGPGISPVVNSVGRSSAVNRSVRPAVNNPATNTSPGVRGTGTIQRTSVNSENNNRISRPTTINNSNNSTPTRTSTPTVRSGGSGSMPSSGGSRSGGRR